MSTPDLPYSMNGLRFEYAATSFDNALANRFQSILEGFDPHWSPWTDEPVRTYTNLPQGSYRYRVRARNIYGQESAEAVYLFTIRAPWYQTIWAYLSYLVIGGVFLFGLVRLRTQQLETRSRLLEQTVAERTEKLHQRAEELKEALAHLRATQQQLITQEKLASLGQLTAGIAHEIKNPLNFVNNFSELVRELSEELSEMLEANRDKPIAEIEEEVRELVSDLGLSADKINEHGKRADAIVRSMLEHSRGTPGDRRPVDVNGLLEEYVNLAFHGMRAQVSDFPVTIERDFDETVGEIEMVPQEMGRVLVNLLSNAFDAVLEKAQTNLPDYQPRVWVRSARYKETVEIRVQDNGPGIPRATQEKIFDPFFTTKPTGSGTGLGLSLSYEIVTRDHGGLFRVESEIGKGATFIIILPIK